MIRKTEEKKKILDEGKISLKTFRQTVMSYVGICLHENTVKTRERLKSIYREEYAEYKKRRLK